MKFKRNTVMFNSQVLVVITLFFFFISSQTALAAQKYWVGRSGGLTNSTANWSLTSGGAGGVPVPNNYDTVNYNIGAVGSSIVNADMTVADFLSTVDYTGIISINDGVTLTVGLASNLPALVAVSKTGTQIATTTIPVTALDLGGAFLFTATEGNATSTVIKLKQIGSVATTTFDNIQLFYKNAVAGECSATKPSGTATFGTAGTFDADNIATTTGAMPLLSDTPVCIYITYDLTGTYSTPILGRSIDLEITNPSTDVVATNGTVTTTGKVNISGRTMVSTSSIISMLSLHMSNADEDPTVFYLQNDAVWKMVHGGTPVRLTNPNLKVHNLTFTNMTGTNTNSTGVVKIQLTISNVDIGAETSFLNVTRTLQTTATVQAWSVGN